MKSVVVAAFCLSCAGVVACGCGPSRDARAVVAAELGPPPAGSAEVCVVRPESFASDVTMKVRDNDRLVGATRGTTYFCYLAQPGKHQITSDADDTGPTFLQADAGRRYWLHQEVVDFVGFAHAHLDWVDESAASELVDACNARVMVSVPGHESSPDAQPIAPARL